MKHSIVWFARITALAMAFASLAQGASPALEPILLQASSSEDLRARLWERARSADTDREVAGETHYYRGVSFERAGMVDSAIASYRRAVETRGAHLERLACVDLLLLRRGPNDFAEAMSVIEAGRALATEGYREKREYVVRTAWGLSLAGHADSALRMVAPVTEHFSRIPQWRYRLARIHLEAGDARAAFLLLLPLAATSRGTDQDIQSLLKRSVEGTGGARNLGPIMARAVSSRDDLEQAVIDRMKGTRVTFAGKDGFPLTGIVRAPERGARRGAVVLVAPEDTLADYDSLGIALNRAGIAVMLLQIRGSGWSVAPTCPSPDTWWTREEQLQRLTARDVATAFHRLAAEIPVDTARYLVAGVGSTASVAVQAADLDSRAKALLLLSPAPEAVERGPMRARLARLQLPAYFLSGAADQRNAPVTEALYQAGNRRQSRVTDVRTAAHGARLLYHYPAEAERLTRWLNETLPRAASRSTPRSTRRGG